MADELTHRQREVLELFVAAVRDGTPWPRYIDICDRLAFSSTHAAFCHVQALLKKGWLERTDRARKGAFVLTDHARRIYGLPRRAA